MRFRSKFSASLGEIGSAIRARWGSRREISPWWPTIEGQSPKSPEIEVRHNLIRINGHTVEVEQEIVHVLLLKDRIILSMDGADYPSDDEYRARNVLAVDFDGCQLWRIEPSPVAVQVSNVPERAPYGGSLCEKGDCTANGDSVLIRLLDSNESEFRLNPDTGKLGQRVFGRFTGFDEDERNPKSGAHGNSWHPPFREDVEVVQAVVGSEGLRLERPHDYRNAPEGCWAYREAEMRVHMGYSRKSAEAIRSASALPRTPAFISDVSVPPGTNIRIGAAAKHDRWGDGGAVQIQILDVPKRTWFGPPRALK